MFFSEANPSTMRSVDNAMADILRAYKGVTFEIEPDTPQRTLLTVSNERVPGSYLKIEVLDVEGTAVACVLERINLGYRSMSRFMHRLMNALED